MTDGTVRHVRGGKRESDLRGDFTVVAVPGTHRDNTKKVYKGSRKTNSKRRLSKAMKQKLLLDARIAGRSWREAAKIAGYSSVSGAFKAGADAIAEIPREAADEARSIEMHRLDEIVRSNWSRMQVGDAEASNVILRAIDRRAKMLGLDLQEPEPGLTIDVRVQALLVSLITMPELEFDQHESRIDELVDASQRSAHRARRTQGIRASAE